MASIVDQLISLREETRLGVERLEMKVQTEANAAQLRKKKVLLAELDADILKFVPVSDADRA